MNIATARAQLKLARLMGAYPHDKIALADDWKLRLEPDDRMRRIRYGEDFRLKPKVAGALFNLNGTLDEGEIERALLANRDWELAGTNAVNTQANLLHGADGGLTLTTGEVANDQMILAPLSEATVKEDGTNNVTYTSIIQATEWKTSKQPMFRVIFRLPEGDLADHIFWAGLKLTSTSVIATDNDQAFFRAAAQALHRVTSVGGTDSDVDTGKELQVGVLNELVIAVDRKRVPHYYLNSLYLGKGGALASLSTLKPFVGVQTGTTAAQSLTVDYVEISRDRA